MQSSCALAIASTARASRAAQLAHAQGHRRQPFHLLPSCCALCKVGTHTPADSGAPSRCHHHHHHYHQYQRQLEKTPAGAERAYTHALSECGKHTTAQSSRGPYGTASYHTCDVTQCTDAPRLSHFKVQGGSKHMLYDCNREAPQPQQQQQKHTVCWQQHSLPPCCLSTT